MGVRRTLVITAVACTASAALDAKVFAADMSPYSSVSRVPLASSVMNAPAVSAPKQSAAAATLPALSSAQPAAVAGTGIPAPSSSEPPPFGASLFTRPFMADRPNGLNPDYVVVPGDRIAIHLWGAADAEDVTTVDAQGNIFLPGIGPIKIAGVRAADLDRRVRDRVTSVFSNNFDLYVNVVTPTPVGVFVTGAVKYPGQYGGMPSEGPLTFLHRAGGIDADRGSYRRIRILRKGREIMRTDLYAFLRYGQVPNLRFQDEDVILVEERGPAITVDGPTLNPFRFELSALNTPGEELAILARPLPKVSHVAVSGTRANGPFAVYVSFDEFRRISLQDGDRVHFEADEYLPTITVSVEGSHIGPSYYTVSRDATLPELLDHVSVDPNLAQVDAVYIKRKSVAHQQREIIERALKKLEESVLTAPAWTEGEASTRVKEAELVSQFIEKTKMVQPEGRVVVSERGQPADIRLEADDVIVIPEQTQVVIIGGEVLLPQAVVYQSDFTLEDYVKRAGGYTDRADNGKFAVIHQNSAVAVGSNATVQPGDQLIVFPKVDFKTIPVTKDIVQILFQAIASSALVLALL